jgi:hypothetical protein
MRTRVSAGGAEGERFELSIRLTTDNGFRDWASLAQPCALRPGARHNARQFWCVLARPRPRENDRDHLEVDAKVRLDREVEVEVREGHAVVLEASGYEQT